ncbi:DUF1127 domain-containing protein [Jiella sp. MQZ9-1]|uniref:DUF1127 domain-containing protein n=1 Tax=Jiella flava TaxID=2816857 RepID=A0A939FSL0_9HYPH|nr:DUF1127 domain-containing protein [Jiella flava]MBO0661148.1 DUF1127 domain-containing protein [Jiella flava]MCD2469794.1 DUF1127 domain-containing protein [Jiella flava]
MTIIVRSTPTQPASNRFAAGLTVFATAVRAIVKTMINRHRVKSLADMPDYVLKDIGLRRDDIATSLVSDWREDPSYKLALLAARRRRNGFER